MSIQVERDVSKYGILVSQETKAPFRNWIVWSVTLSKTIALNMSVTDLFHVIVLSFNMPTYSQLGFTWKFTLFQSVIQFSLPAYQSFA